MRLETERGKDWFTIRDLFANERCSQAIFDFLSITVVGRLVTMPAEERPERGIRVGTPGEG